ncbi:MAG: protease SohB, partial [Gammaproteobacteria bacterium]
MIELFAEYGLFLAKTITILVFIWLLMVLIFTYSKKSQKDDHFEITNLNKKYKNMADSLRFSLLPKKELKKAKNKRKQEIK